MGRVWGMYEGESGGEYGVCMRERVGRVRGMYGMYMG